MRIEYNLKKSEKEILNELYNNNIKFIEGSKDSSNKLFHGNNLDILKYLLKDCKMKGKIDLIYIDPPYSTKNIFKIGDDRTSTISSSNEDDIAYSDTLTGDEYLEFLRERLILLRELLSEHGSIYLHLDYKVGHYAKIIMDEIFGSENFRTDISRIKCNPKNFKRKGYGNIKDLILFYSKNNTFTWNYPTLPFTDEDIERLYKKKDNKGRYTTVPIHAPGESNGLTGEMWHGMYPPKGRHWRSPPEELDKLEKLGLIEWSKNGNPRKKNYAHDMKKKGKPMQDIWKFKDKQNPSYPTEKNLEMLCKIIEASSNKDDLILDCFAGSGTTLLAAQMNNRHWIGIDNSPKAIEIVKKRLNSIKPTLDTPKTEYGFYSLN